MIFAARGYWYAAVILFVKGGSLDRDLDIVQDLSLARKASQRWRQCLFDMSKSIPHLEEPWLLVFRRGTGVVKGDLESVLSRWLWPESDVAYLELKWVFVLTSRYCIGRTSLCQSRRREHCCYFVKYLSAD